MRKLLISGMSTFCILTLYVVSVSAQHKITLQLTNAPFSELVSKIEEKTPFRFYYNPLWTDSLSISLSVSEKTIQEIIEEAFAESSLLYSITPQMEIFVTRGRTILTELPAGLFAIVNGKSRIIDFNYADFEKKEARKKIQEEKIYIIGPKTSNLQGTALLTGSLRDGATGEPLIGASVYSETLKTGAFTDLFGKYSFKLPKGRHQLTVKSIGMKITFRQVMIYGDGLLDIDLEEDIIPLKEVIVESGRETVVAKIQMGTEHMDIRTMKQLPLALGETDIMKAILTLPGVQTVGEGTIGLNVRGGATNQNLILFNDAPVYNPSHLFGFFSTFNPDVLKSVDLYKSGITADYGGRLSSVMDVASREGNLKKFAGSGGLSPVTGRMSFEGPLLKNRASYLVGMRSTYSNWILRQLDSEQFQNSVASFYDVNANIGFKINSNNHLHAFVYASEDRFRLNNDTLYTYSDKSMSLKWRHRFSDKLFGLMSTSFSEFNYAISSKENPITAFQLGFAVSQISAKADFSYLLNDRHTFQAGFNTTRYFLEPGNLMAMGNQSIVKNETVQSERAWENALFMGDHFEINQSLSLYAGVRYSFFNYTGPRTLFTYAEGASRDVTTIQDTITYGGGKTLKFYHGLEPRISLKYAVNRNSSVKLSYNRMRQYIQMLSNTTAIAPTDIWKLSDPYIPPQIGDQVSIGYYRNVMGGLIETSVEGYYKLMRNSLDFKNGAILLLNHHMETDVVKAQGRAYGLEFLVKKSSGKLNGWLSYTWSRSILQTRSPFTAETVNEGDLYPSSYDKPHSANMISNYKVSRRLNFSLNMTYSTGRPITLPIAKYQLGGSSRLQYSDRNAYRIPDYFRLDASVNIEGNHKVKKAAHNSWTLAVYNLTGRHNAYSVFFTSENGSIKGYQLSIFARPIPTITYNFRF